MHLVDDSLDTTKFSNVVGDNIEDNAIDEKKLTNDSIYTYHFIDGAVGTQQIGSDTINNPSNNIALHAITSKDIVVEELNGQYFAAGAATGRTIASQALFATTTHMGIETSILYGEITLSPRLRFKSNIFKLVKCYSSIFQSIIFPLGF